MDNLHIIMDHLGLVASVIKDIGLVEKIDKRISVSKDKGAKLTIGQRVASMIMNGLGFMDDRLYMFPKFLENKPINRLFDDSVCAADFNDDSLGRGLDALFDFGVTPLFSELAFAIGVEQNLLGHSAHFDTPSMSLYGEYNGDEAAATVDSPAKAPIDVTYGHSKANRPDLKQVVLNLAITGAANFPIWMEACNGNASDKVVLQAAAARMQAFCKELKDSPSFLYVGDSAMYERCIKEKEAYIKVLWHLSNQVFTCDHDALLAAGKAVKALKYHQVTWNTAPIEKHVKLGRPKAGDVPQVVGYRIQGTLNEDQERIDLAKRSKGRFILASNELNQIILPDATFLPEYKEQIKTEQGFRFIKSDTFEVDSIFLQKPSRIEALMMVMTLCLMVYSIAQHKMRQALEQAQETVPDQLTKQTKKPTMAWIFRLFHGVHVWTIRQGENTQTLVVNLTALMKRIISYFGPTAEKIYGLSG